MMVSMHILIIDMYFLFFTLFSSMSSFSFIKYDSCFFQKFLHTILWDGVSATTQSVFYSELKEVSSDQVYWTR